MKLRQLLFIICCLIATTEVQSQEKPDPEFIYEVCDTMPEFPGGIHVLIEYLRKQIDSYNLDLPVGGNGSTGRTIIRFVVEKNGTVSNPVVTRRIDNILDKIGLEIVNNMPTWKPGVQNGQVVRCYYTIPMMWR